MELIRNDSIIGKILNKTKSPEKHQHDLQSVGIYEKMICSVCGEIYMRKVEK